jgi:hypothetical protein
MRADTPLSNSLCCIGPTRSTAARQKTCLGDAGMATRVPRFTSPFNPSPFAPASASPFGRRCSLPRCCSPASHNCFLPRPSLADEFCHCSLSPPSPHFLSSLLDALMPTSFWPRRCSADLLSRPSPFLSDLALLGTADLRRRRR